MSNRLVLFATALALSFRLFAQGASIGPERAISMPQPVPAGLQIGVAAASNGEVSLVAWSDAAGISGVLVDASARPLGPAFLIAKDFRLGDKPVVTSFGERFIVVGYRSTSNALFEVSPSGEVLRSIPDLLPLIDEAVGGESQIMIVGSNPQTGATQALLLDRDLNVEVVVDASKLFHGSERAAIAAGTGFFFASAPVCMDDSCVGFGVQIAQITSTGSVRITNIDPISSLVRDLKFADGRDRVFLEWVEDGENLTITVLSPDGSVLSPPNVAFHLTADIHQFLHLVSVASNSGIPRNVVRSSYEENWGQAWVLSIGPSGNLIDSAPLDLRWPTGLTTRRRALEREPLPPRYIQLVSARNQLLAFWWNGAVQLAGVLDQNGNLASEPTVFTSRVPNQDSPDVATSSTDALVVWMESHVGRGPVSFESFPRIYGRLLGPDGLPVSDREFVIRDGGTAPSVAFDGRHYVVAWIERGSVWLTYVSSDESVAPPRRVDDEATASDRPVIACERGSCLIAWGTSSEDRAVHGVVVTESSAGPPFAISLPARDDATVPPYRVTQFKVHASVAASPEAYLVSWMDYTSAPFVPSTGSVRAARVSRDGSLLQTEIPLALGQESRQDPVSSWNGDKYVAAWTWMYGPWMGPHKVYARRIDPSGALLDGNDPVGAIEISRLIGDQRQPAISCRPSVECLVAWTNSPEPYKPSDIYATLLAPSGLVQDPEGFAIASKDESEDEAKVATLPQNRFIIVYRRMSFEDGAAGAVRIYARVVSHREP